MWTDQDQRLTAAAPPLARMPNATACPPSPSPWKAIPGIETHRTQSAPCGMIGRGEPGPQLACGWHAMGLVRHGVPQMRAYAGGVIHGQARAGR